MSKNLSKRFSLAFIVCFGFNFIFHNYELNPKQISSYKEEILAESEICKSNSDIQNQYFTNSYKQIDNQLLFKNNILYYDSKQITYYLKKQILNICYDGLKIQFNQQQSRSRSPPTK